MSIGMERSQCGAATVGRSAAVSVFLTAVVLVLAACSGIPQGGVAGYSNPVFRPVFADPSVVRGADGLYYACATEEDWADGHGRRSVPLLRSTDLVDWTYVGNAFSAETRPAWHPGAIWAPHLIFRNGSFYLYYSMAVWGVESGVRGPAIGVAVSDSPEGPYRDLGKVFSSDEIGVRNSIDPFVIEEDGAPYLFWGSFSGIYAVQLSIDGRRAVGEKVRIAGDAFEAPWIHRRDGRYYFFGSTGSCCEGPFSSYAVSVGRSDTLLGPYRDAQGRSILDGTGTTLLSGGDLWVGPGHNAIAGDSEGNDWILYHAVDRRDAYLGGATKRPLFVEALSWRGAWPHLTSGVPSERPAGRRIQERQRLLSRSASD